MIPLPASVAAWLDHPAPATVASVGLDGYAHLFRAVVAREGDDVLTPIVEGSAYHHDMIYDPRATVVVTDPANPSRWAEIRGEVEMTTAGARQLADAVGMLSTSETPEFLVVRVVPQKVTVHD